MVWQSSTVSPDIHNFPTFVFLFGFSVSWNALTFAWMVSLCLIEKMFFLLYSVMSCNSCIVSYHDAALCFFMSVCSDPQRLHPAVRAPRIHPAHVWHHQQGGVYDASTAAGQHRQVISPDRLHAARVHGVCVCEGIFFWSIVLKHQWKCFIPVCPKWRLLILRPKPQNIQFTEI